MSPDLTEDLTDKEQAFRALLRDPKAYAKWAEKVRARWAEGR